MGKIIAAIILWFAAASGVFFLLTHPALLGGLMFAVAVVWALGKVSE